ncbi:MAG: T9SS type A sorting domain-containing protein [Melioribacteraceae bacterium]
MKKIYKLFVIMFVFGLSTNIISQPNLTLEVKNQTVIGTDFLFDIYLTAPDDFIFLGTADFVLTFNSAAFTSPTLSREAASFWILTSTDGTPVGSNYRTLTSTAAITSNELLINLNQVSFGDQTDFDANVAKINSTANTHAMGRYRVSGISNSSASMNLQWKTAGGGVVTQVFTLANTTPWASSPTVLNAINPSDQPLPVELSSFNVNAVEGTKAQLNWETATEVNNYGFEVERSIVSEKAKVKSENETANSAVDNLTWEKVAFVEGHGNSNSPKLYSFTDKNLVGGSKFMYRLKQIDIDGTFEYSDAVEIEVLPTKYELLQNYPNPFNPTTNIKFSLPEDAKVSINIYNVLGEKVASILNEDLKAGFHQVDFNAFSSGYQLASGIYLYSIESSNFRQVKKMMLMK